MKIIRYRFDHNIAYGAIVDQTVHSLPGAPWQKVGIGPAVAALDQVKLLAPCQPTKIIAVGLNYAAHAGEAGADLPTEPIIFLKPPSSVIGPGATIIYPSHLSTHVEHEAELAVVIGRQACQVPPDKAHEFIFGYTCGNDVTARNLQKRDAQWTRGKGIDTFCPLGPWIETELDTTDLAVRCRVNGELKQDGHTRDMLFPVNELIAYISAVMTLEPGDVILTGTPEGVSPIQPGDRVSVEIEGIGTLLNEVNHHG